MSDQYDFERAWLHKLSGCLEKRAGPAVREKVMAGAENLTDASDRTEIIFWTQRAMERLESALDAKTAQAVMTGCACRYPVEALAAAKKAYRQTGDLDRVHGMLQDQFEAFLRGTLHLEESLVDEVIGRGWGLAGVKEGNKIIATKIPKSGFLAAYLQESDPAKRREIYCHCPRVRDALKLGESLPAVYCYCGAGFYRGIWEEILDRPVEVELLKSVLQGDEVCSVAIHLPAG